jgi:hypothetical protein
MSLATWSTKKRGAAPFRGPQAETLAVLFQIRYHCLDEERKHATISAVKAALARTLVRDHSTKAHLTLLGCQGSTDVAEEVLRLDLDENRR